MQTTESIKGALKRGKRGAVVFENEYGTLETKKVVNGDGRFIGSVVIDGKEKTRTMTGDKYSVRDRWEKWQQIVIEDNVKRAKTEEKECTGMEKAIKTAEAEIVENTTSEMTTNAVVVNETVLKQLDTLNKNIEQIALALIDLAEKVGNADDEGAKCKKGATKSEVDSMEAGISKFLEGKTWLDFVNVPTDRVFRAMYKPFIASCGDGYKEATQRMLTKRISEKFKDTLDYEYSSSRANRKFVAKQTRLAIA